MSGVYGGVLCGVASPLGARRSSRLADYPSAFFNGIDFRLATYTGGPTYVPDNLGVLRSPGANLPAVQGMRLDGVTYINTDESGNPILPTTPQKTVTYNTDWTAKAFAETFDKFDISDPLKSPGWLCEPVKTNKVTCRKANPVDTTGLTKGGDAAAVLSVVDDTAALTAAGLIGVCSLGKVYKLDNSLGVDYAYVSISGPTGNTDAHSISVIGKRTAGTAGARLNSGAGSLAITFSGTIYSRYCANNITPESTARGLVIQASAGSVVYFILPQLEEGPFCTSPICKASYGSDPLTSLTRAATVASFPTAGKIPVNNFAIRMIVVPMASGQITPRLFSIYVDAGNRFNIYISGNSIVCSLKNSGVFSNDTVLPIVIANGTPVDVVCVKHNTGIRLACRSFSSGWSAWVNSNLSTDALSKGDIPLGAPYQIGAVNNVDQFTGNISLFDCVPIPSGITDPMAWAKTHWGVA